MTITPLHSMTENTFPAIDDEMYLLDNPGGGGGSDARIKLSNLFYVINGLTADSAPVRSAYYVVTYDTSANTPKKVLLNNLGAYSIQFTALTFDPADSTTYYIGNYIAAPTTTALRRRLYIPRAGVITKCFIDVTVTGFTGATGNATFSIRLNNTTDTAVSAAAALSAVNNLYSKTDLAIAVAAGDYVEIKMENPAWGTNPTGVQISGLFFVE